MVETASDIAAGTSEACDKTGGDRIVHARHDDGDSPRQVLGSLNARMVETTIALGLPASNSAARTGKRLAFPFAQRVSNT